MANNLFISYDLNKKDKNYDGVFEAIKALGSWAKLQKSFWYVDSMLSAANAFDKIRPAMDDNDSLVVVDATNNKAKWYGVPSDGSDLMKKLWYK